MPINVETESGAVFGFRHWLPVVFRARGTLVPGVAARGLPLVIVTSLMATVLLSKNKGRRELNRLDYGSHASFRIAALFHCGDLDLYPVGHQAHVKP